MPAICPIPHLEENLKITLQNDDALLKKKRDASRFFGDETSKIFSLSGFFNLILIHQSIQANEMSTQCMSQ